MLRRNLRIASVGANVPIWLYSDPYWSTPGVWDPHTPDKVSRMETVQRRAARYVYNNYRRTASVTEMLGNLVWKSLQHRRKMARLTTMFKVLHNTISVPHASCLVPAARCSRRTNHALKLQTIASKNNYYRLSFFPRTIKEWKGQPSVAEAKGLGSIKDDDDEANFTNCVKRPGWPHTQAQRSKGEGAVLKRPAGSDDPGKPLCTPARDAPSAEHAALV
ncbi:hypothetical protein Bbelb_276270 [Branchiostoma belcheri]|nr:hypothetical protein Bbelb_276270 [Branchiostoma belcheri]